jgi:preprotein translocase subunit SecG
MVGFLLVVHYVICVAMVLVILLQSGKGGGLAGAFGGGGSTIFGGRGAGTVLTRATMILGGLFFVTSLTLALMSATGGPGGASSGKSLIQEEAKRASGTQPVSGTPSGGQTLPPPGTPSPTGAAQKAPASQTKPAPTPQTTPAPAPGGTK